MNYGTPAAPAAGGKSEKARAEAYCGECPVHFSAPFFMNSRIAPAPNGVGAQTVENASQSLRPQAQIEF